MLFFHRLWEHGFCAWHSLATPKHLEPQKLYYQRVMWFAELKKHFWKEESPQTYYTGLGTIRLTHQKHTAAKPCRVAQAHRGSRSGCCAEPLDVLSSSTTFKGQASFYTTGGAFTPSSDFTLRLGLPDQDRRGQVRVYMTTAEVHQHLPFVCPPTDAPAGLWSSVTPTWWPPQPGPQPISSVLWSRWGWSPGAAWHWSYAAPSGDERDSTPERVQFTITQQQNEWSTPSQARSAQLTGLQRLSHKLFTSKVLGVQGYKDSHIHQ